MIVGFWREVLVAAQLAGTLLLVARWGVSDAADHVELAWVEPVVPAGPARVSVLLDGVVVGDLDYRVCVSACQIGIVEQLRVDSAACRRRLATRALHAVVGA